MLVLPAVLCTVFVANAGIMLLELVAGRLIARHLGQSLYTWTTIIGIVLAGMAIGNYVGGRLADRYPWRRLLACLFLLAGVGCVSVLAINAGVGNWQVIREYPWPARILVHILATLLAPCILLGTISPVAARAALTYGRQEGRTIGLVFAAAAAGSIGGTFLTGFYLVMVMGVTTIISLVAVLMGLLGIAYALSAVISRAEPISMTALEPNGEVESVPEEPRSSFSLLLPNLTVFISNAAFMVLELAASRMATRHLGYSVYTWTTLLGTVLAGIMLGNYLGGRLSDRFQTRKLLSILFAIAGFACLAVPAWSTWLALGPLFEEIPTVVERIVYYITFAFFIPSVFIGTIGPVAARMALEKSRGAGNTLGKIYAWGAVGSVAGTFITGYILIDHLWPGGTVGALALLLALMGSTYNRRNLLAHAGTVLCAVALILTFAPWSSVLPMGRVLKLREEKNPGVLYADHSQYSWIAVLDNPYDPNIRELRLDMLTHSVVDISDPTRLLYEYEWVYDIVLDMYYPDRQPLSAMIIGGGGFTFPHYLEVTRPGSYIEAAEIDPAVTEAAHKAFGFPRETSVKIFNMDARNRIEDLIRLKRMGREVPVFDCIFGDSINQYSVPFQLTTVEFNEKLHELLADEGVYMLNLVDSLVPGKFLGATVNTCRQVFEDVNVLTANMTANEIKDSRGTFIIVCRKKKMDDGRIREQLWRTPYRFTGELLTESEIDELVARSGGMILTDDYAPVDNLLTHLATQLSDHMKTRQAIDNLRKIGVSI